MTVSPSPPARRTNWWVLSVLNGSYSMVWMLLLLSVLQTMVTGLVPDKEKDSTLAKVLTYGLLVGLFSYPLSGYISDNLKGRWLRRHGQILLGITGGLVSLFLLPGIGTVVGLTVFFVAVQATGTLASAPYFALMPDLIPQQDRGKASAAMGFMEIIGRVAAIAVMGVVMSHQGAMQKLLKGMGLSLPPLKAAVAVAAGLMMAALLLGNLLIQFFIPVPAKKEGPQQHAPHPQRVVMTEEERKKGLTFLILSRIFNQAAIFSITSFLAFYLKDFLGAGTMERANAWMATLLMVATAFTVPTVLLTGGWVDRNGRKGPLVLSSLVMMLVCGGFMLINNLTQAYVVGAVFGLALGMFTTSDWALAVDLVPQHEDSAFSLGTWQASLVLGQIVGLPIAERVLTWGHHAWGKPNGYLALFSYVAVCLLWALVFLRWVPETLKKQEALSSETA